MTLKITTWRRTGDDTFDVPGHPTIKDATKPSVLKVTFLGFGPGMAGAQVSGWEAKTLNKKLQFNLAGPAMLGKVLGDDITINIGVEAGIR